MSENKKAPANARVKTGHVLDDYSTVEEMVAITKHEYNEYIMLKTMRGQLQHAYEKAFKGGSVDRKDINLIFGFDYTEDRK